MIMVNRSPVTKDMLAPVGAVNRLELDATFKAMKIRCHVNVPGNNKGAADLTKDFASILSQLVHGVKVMNDVPVASLKEQSNLSLIWIQRSRILELGHGIDILGNIL